MSEALYICIDCELANANAEPTPLNAQSVCPRCGSSSEVPVDTLRELDAKRKRAEQAPPSVDKDHAKRVNALREHRKRDSEPLRAYLMSIAASAHDVIERDNVVDALREWDGWAWHVDYAWEPGLTHFVITLIQGVRGAPRWEITLDARVLRVESFQDGMN